MTNQYVLLVVHQKPVAHKAHANAFIFFPVARNFPPLPILAGSPPLLFSFLFFPLFSFPSPFFYFKFHRSGFNGFLPSPPSLWAENTGSRSSWISEMVIDAPFDPEPEICSSRPRRIFGRDHLFFDVFFPSMMLVNAMIRSKNAECLIIIIIIIFLFFTILGLKLDQNYQ